MKDYQIKSGSKVNLAEWDPRDTSEFDGDKDQGKERLLELNTELESLQEMLYAQHKHRLLVVLQGMDTSGKDGVVRNVFEGVNPQGVRVASFKGPTLEELDHDYLWRIHQQTPRKGEIVIFNRSHYEDVLVVRVKSLVPPEVWKKRYDQINEFERMMVEEGTVLLKFYLHISKEEQKERLQARVDDPTKHWKFNPDDLKERARWDEYIEAYEAVLEKTSTEWAPWYVVPADRKWYRNLVIGEVLVKALQDLKMEYPKPNWDPKTIVIV